MNKDAKIYVAGHTGLVGSAVLQRFAASGYHNIVTRDFNDLDLRRQEHVEAFFSIEKPDYVVLAAAKVGGILANSTYKAEFIYDNLMIATNVIHAAYKFGVKRLVNLGSSCIYPKNAPQPLKEEYLLTGPLEETNEPYAIAKIAAIKLCRYYNEQYGTQFISLMPTNMYGPNDNYNLEISHVVPAIVRKLHLAKLLKQKRFDEIRFDLQQRSIGFGISEDWEMCSIDRIIGVLQQLGITMNQVSLWGSGTVFREFMHVDDLADDIIYFIERKNHPILDELINIGTGQDVCISELAELIAYVVQYKGSIFFNKNNLDGTQRKLLDVAKLAYLERQTRISLSDGIMKVYQDYCSHSKDLPNKIIEEVSSGVIF